MMEAVVAVLLAVSYMATLGVAFAAGAMFSAAQAAKQRLEMVEKTKGAVLAVMQRFKTAENKGVQHEQ